jgi:hypothetical protein
VLDERLGQHPVPAGRGLLGVQRGDDVGEELVAAPLAVLGVHVEAAADEAGGALVRADRGTAVEHPAVVPARVP